MKYYVKNLKFTLRIKVGGFGKEAICYNFDKRTLSFELRSNNLLKKLYYFSED